MRHTFSVHLKGARAKSFAIGSFWQAKPATMMPMSGSSPPFRRSGAKGFLISGSRSCGEKQKADTPNAKKLMVGPNRTGNGISCSGLIAHARRDSFGVLCRMQFWLNQVASAWPKQKDGQYCISTQSGVSAKKYHSMTADGIAIKQAMLNNVQTT
mmetsp:Transcript_67021/g.174462  ORF Transcript_67021/g.174462 Transcript_67021/m.174462 type:complete len:155 (+) Transcript_67021:293-757(+)